MRNARSRHPAWREAAVVFLGLPVVITLAVMAFAWPAGRLAPRDLPVGIVGTGAAGQHAVDGLVHAEPGAFDLRLYPDQGAARSAIEHREVYGAFVVAPHEVTVLEASAAGPSVAQLLGDVGHRLAAGAAAQQAAAQQTGAGQTPSAQRVAGGSAAAQVPVRVQDVVPVATADPKGAVFGSVVFPLTICGVLIGAAIARARGIRRGWHRAPALLAACAVAAVGAYAVAQGWLGALPHDHVATWAVLSLVLVSVGATAAGLIRLLGPGGIGVSAALMVVVGNSFSGATSAPEMLPEAVGHVGQWLPTGAGAGLLRDTAYFDGHGGAGHLAVLVLWSVCGLTAAVFGRPVLGQAPAGNAGATTGAVAAAPPLASREPAGAVPPDPRPAHAHARHDGG